MLQMIVEGLLVAWTVAVTAVVVRFVWWVVSPLPDSDVQVVNAPESPLEDIEDAYARMHEQANSESVMSLDLAGALFVDENSAEFGAVVAHSYDKETKT